MANEHQMSISVEHGHEVNDLALMVYRCAQLRHGHKSPQISTNRLHCTTFYGLNNVFVWMLTPIIVTSTGFSPKIAIPNRNVMSNCGHLFLDASLQLCLEPIICIM